MPDKNFEQQARDMVNGFEKEPTPEVWQNVRNAIQEPRRKRRFALWWWLLPIALLGGSLAFYTATQKSKNIEVAKTDSMHQKTINKKLPANKETTALTQQQEPRAVKPETTKEHVSVYGSLLNTSKLRQKQSEKSSTPDIIINKEEISNKTVEVHAAGTNKINEKKVDANGGIALNDNTSLPTITDDNIRANNSNIILQNLLPLQFHDSLQTVLSSKDTILSAISKNKDSTDIPKINSSGVFKSKRITALHWGIFAEGGIAARKSSLFSIAGLDKRNDVQTSFPGNNYLNSAGGITSGSNEFSYNNYIQHGAAFGLGIAVQKKLSRTIDISADVAYHYQSFKVSTTVYKDSLVLNNVFTSLAGSYGATQTFHFTSFFTSINWHFINTKHIQLGISAGADNLILLAAKQKLNQVNSSNFALADAQQLSDRTIAINNFYTYQPSLFAGVLVNIKTGNKQLQLIPFTRSSFRTFDKNTSGNNNHLFSAGLRAVYFFK